MSDMLRSMFAFTAHAWAVRNIAKAEVASMAGHELAATEYYERAAQAEGVALEFLPEHFEETREALRETGSACLSACHEGPIFAPTVPFRVERPS